jgi:hypothetical protein
LKPLPPSEITFQRNRRKARAAYAPADGKLAAAMTTIKARRRLRRNGVERSNDFNRRIASSFRDGGHKCSAKTGANRKMGPPSVPVEGALEIATPPSPDRGLAVDFLP